MSSSYQPKIFRYQNGCCICKAKSSSSRFTCSQKYEFGFRDCFRLREDRTGMICNACVLVVKRWSNLKNRLSKNWNHVVDSKFNNRRKSKHKKVEKTIEPSEKNIFVKKHKYVSKSNKKSSFEEDLSDDQGLGEDISTSSASSIAGEERLSEGLASMNSSLAPSPQPHYPCFVENRRKRRKPIVRKIDISPVLKQMTEGQSDFLDGSYWKEEHVCCGRIWEGRNKEVAVEPTFSYCSRKTHSSTLLDSTSLIYLGKPDDEGVDMYEEESTTSSSSFYGQKISPEHSAGMKMLLQFSHTLTV